MFLTPNTASANSFGCENPSENMSVFTNTQPLFPRLHSLFLHQTYSSAPYIVPLHNALCSLFFHENSKAWRVLRSISHILSGLLGTWRPYSIGYSPQKKAGMLSGSLLSSLLLFICPAVFLIDLVILHQVSERPFKGGLAHLKALADIFRVALVSVWHGAVSRSQISKDLLGVY